jgi:hypothetical protein
MADYKKYKGTGLWQTIPQLSASNKDEWFTSISTLARGEDAEYLFSSIEQYTVITEAQRQLLGELDSSWVAQALREGEGFGQQKIWRNETLRKAYLKAEASFILNLHLKLNQVDADRVEGNRHFHEKIATLRAKYYTVTFSQSQELIGAFTQWKMDEVIPPTDNWIKLHSVRKEAHRHTDLIFNDNFTWSIFLQGLRPKGAYDNITEGFSSSESLSQEQKLTKLDEKWYKERGQRRSKEKSFVAHGRYDSSSEGEGLDFEEAFAALVKKFGKSSAGARLCFRCGSSKHLYYNCEFALKAFNYAKSLRIKEHGDESDEDRKTFESIPRGPRRRFRSPSERPQTSSISRGRNSPNPKSDKLNSDWRAARSTSRPTKNVSWDDKDKANLAKEQLTSDSEAFDEFGGISWERRSEIPTTTAAADTGCSSHMTDNKRLFRSMKPCRRSIQVGGGKLYSVGIGTIEIHLENGSMIFLEDALFVPELGCTLVSAQKLLGSELIAFFDSNCMQFLRRSDDVLLIEANSQRGLYIISNITKEAHGKSFATAKKRSSSTSTALLNVAESQPSKWKPLDLATEIEPANNSPPSNEISEEAAAIARRGSNLFESLEDEGTRLSEDSEEDEQPEATIERNEHPTGITKRERNRVTRQIRQTATKPKGQKEEAKSTFTLKERRLQRELARYVYYHRRFCHAGAEVLSMLHTVTDIKKIVIPEQIPLCETCSRQKIHKRQSKQLAEHKQEPLALISFDVAGPFPVSYRGFRYFGEIVDNWSRKTWTLLFKSRKDLLPKLNQWKLEQERSGNKVKAVRTDNAPEILETLNQWNKSCGIEVQTTEPYTSAQNGTSERSIQQTEHNVRAMLDDAQLPVEFWCEGAEAQAYVKARTRRGPRVVEEVIDEISGKPFRIEYRISPEEAYTGKVPRSRGHIRAWGCKVIAHVARESLPGRQDKFMPPGREGIFMGYDEHTTAHHKVYAPDMHTTIMSSNVRFFEDTPGSSIENYQLWMQLSDGTFEKSDGNWNRHVVRNRRGRPALPGAVAIDGLMPTVDAIRSEGFTTKAADPNTEELQPDVDDAPMATLITPEQETMLAKSKPAVVIKGHKLIEQATAATAASDQNSRNWKLPADPGSSPLDESTLSEAVTTRQLRSSTKRDLAEYEATEPQREVKRHRAMLAILDWFSDEEDVSAKEEIAMLAQAAKHDIPIPSSYKEAMSDPVYK